MIPVGAPRRATYGPSVNKTTLGSSAASEVDAQTAPIAPTVPRWAERVAHAIPFLVLPSGLWRLAVALGFSMGMLNDAGETAVLRGWPALYVAVISVISEGVALTAFGLVRSWGEVVPAWLPVIGGRRVRPKAAIIPATIGSIALMLIWTVGFWSVWTGDQANQMASVPWAVVFAACYAPLNLWGPALLALTWAYRRRTALRDARPEARLRFEVRT